MFTDINEIVEVAAVFKRNKTIPTSIRWNGRLYQIKSINMFHKVGQGEKLVYHFAVSDGINHFKLIFDTSNLNWNLEQVYHQG